MQPIWVEDASNMWDDRRGGQVCEGKAAESLRLELGLGLGLDTMRCNQTKSGSDLSVIVKEEEGGAVSSSAEWCRFQMELSVGAVPLHSDLRALRKQRSLIALAGRRALLNRSRFQRGKVGKTHWVMEVDDAKVAVTRPPESALRLKLRLSSSQRNSWSIHSECIVVQRNKKRTLWQFLTVRFVPDSAATSAYEHHVGSPWMRSFEEVALFFPVEPVSFAPLDGQDSCGLLHALFPTQHAVSMSMHWDGPWMLSSDRERLQEGTAAAEWNMCVLKQLPRLLVCFFKWVATVCAGAEADPTDRALCLSSFYALLPPFALAPSSSSPSVLGKEMIGQETLVAMVLNHQISLEEFVTVISKEPVVPVQFADPIVTATVTATAAAGAVVVEEGGDAVEWVAKGHLPVQTLERPLRLQFVEAQHAMWLPAALLRRVPLTALHAWFGRYPLAVDILGETSHSPLWKCILTGPDEAILAERRPHFTLQHCEELTPIQLSMQVLVALEEVHPLHLCVFVSIS